MSARTTRAQILETMDGFRDVMSTARDQNRGLHAAVAALLPAQSHPLLMHRKDDPDAMRRAEMVNGINAARVLLEIVLAQVSFDLDGATGARLSAIEVFVEQAFTLEEHMAAAGPEVSE